MELVSFQTDIGEVFIGDFSPDGVLAVIQAADARYTIVQLGLHKRGASSQLARAANRKLFLRTVGGVGGFPVLVPARLLRQNQHRIPAHQPRRQFRADQPERVSNGITQTRPQRLVRSVQRHVGERPVDYPMPGKLQ